MPPPNPINVMCRDVSARCRPPSSGCQSVRARCSPTWIVESSAVPLDCMFIALVLDVSMWVHELRRVSETDIAQTLLPKVVVRISLAIPSGVTRRRHPARRGSSCGLTVMLNDRSG